MSDTRPSGDTEARQEVPLRTFSVDYVDDGHTTMDAFFEDIVRVLERHGIKWEGASDGPYADGPPEPAGWTCDICCEIHDEPCDTDAWPVYRLRGGES